MSLIFQEMFERSPIAMLLVQENGEIHLTNKHAEKLFQYDRTELIGQKIEILVPESVRSHHPALVKEYVKAPLSRQMGKGRNLFGVKKDLSLFPVEIGLNPIEIEGKIFVLGSVIDITERIKAEERFEAAVEAAPNGMLMIDAKRTIILVNKKIEEIFGFARKELIGQPIEILIPDDFKGPHPKFVEAYVKKPEPRSMGIGRELFGKHKSGRLIPVEIGLQPVFSHEEVFVISSVVDITARRDADAEIKRKTEELGEFAYRTSHDLRSPLKSINGMAECIADCLEEKDVDGAHQYALKIGSLTTMLMTLIEDILTLTRIELSDEEISVFDFSRYVKNFKEKCEVLIKENGVNLEISLLHKKQLKVQAVRLTQVLDNLVTNAIKYCDPNKGERFVKVRTFDTKDQFFIQVEDNGLGIPEEHQGEVFGMFKRFYGGTIPGSGLGLYMIKKQINMLGAKINFESSPDGTSFYIEFPLNESIHDKLTR